MNITRASFGVGELASNIRLLVNRRMRGIHPENYNPKLRTPKATSSLSRLVVYILILGCFAVSIPVNSQAATANNTKADTSPTQGNTLDSGFGRNFDQTIYKSPKSNPLRLTAASLTKQDQVVQETLRTTLAVQNDTPIASDEAASQEAASQNATSTQEQAETAPVAEPSDQVVEGLEGQAVPSDIVPPYTDQLRTPETTPLFNISQTVSWIILILVLIFAAMLIGWFIRRLITNSLAVDEASAGDLFQARDDESYSFDDDERTVNHLHDHTPDQAAHEETFEEASIDISVTEKPTVRDDDLFDDDHDASQKRGFMSRLFGRRHKSSNEEESIFETSDHAFDDNEEIIDVEPEPVEINATDNEEITREPAAMYDDVPEEETESPLFQSAPLTPQPMQNTHDDMPHTDMPIAAIPTELTDTLKNLEIKQSENSHSINSLEQRLVSYQEGMQNELTTIRNDASTHQAQVDETMEKRFAAMSNSVESRIVRSEKLAHENFSQAENMNTGDLSERLLDLDKKVKDQSNITDVNFNRVLQKLDSLSSPAPQLSRLANDTSELKSQIASLQTLTKSPTTAPASLINEEETKAREQSMRLMRNMETALNEQNRSLRAFREENKGLLRKFDALNDRMDRMENEMQNQRSALIEVIEKYPSAQTASNMQSLPPDDASHQRADALGIMGDARTNNSTQSTLGHQSYANGHSQEKSLTEPQNSFVEPETEEKEPDVTPILVSLSTAADPINSQERAVPPLSPAAIEPQSQITKAEVEEHEERTIRPLTFNFSSGDKSQTDR